MSFGTIFPEDPTNTLAVVHPALWWFAAAIDSLNLTYFFLFLSLFPNGRFAPRWMVWLVGASLLFQIAGQFFPNSPLNTSNGGPVTGTFFLIFIASTVFSLIYRYRHHSTPVERQQTKWVLFAIVLALVLYAPAAIFGPADALLSQFVGSTVLYVALSLIPIAIAISILRYRLWDIDALINRTLVYGLLSASVAGLYILVVGYLGALFRTGGTLLISLLATGLVAVLFQPLRGWLQRNVNRLMYGQRDEPYAVVARLGRRLESALAPEAVLPTIVETVAQALKLPYAAITWQQDGVGVLAATFGNAVDELLRLPLTYQGELIAEQLGLSLKTVRNHVSNIFSKLQVADRAQAVIRAREAGLG